MRFPLVFLLVLFQFTVNGQECRCEEEFRFLKTYMEQNHPGLNVKGWDKSKYQKATQQLAAEIKRTKPDNDCILYLQEYFTLLKDHHIYINPNVPAFKRYNVTSQASLDSLYGSAAYKTTEFRKVDSLFLVQELNQKTGKDPEGWYTDSQGNLIAVVKAPKGKGVFEGVVVSSRTKLFPAGTVKYKFTRRPNGTLWTMLKFPDHQKLYTSIPVSKDGFSYIGLTHARMQSDKPHATASPYEFSVLNSRTNYLRISTFDGALTRKLDSFYTSVDSQIQSRPFLIIDIRGNGGGSDGSYFGLINHFYTRPIYSDSAEIWVSPENIKRYEESLEDMKSNKNAYTQKVIDNEEAFIRRLKSAPSFSFIPLADGPPGVITSEAVQKQPTKIVILMDKSCASSAESFIYYARQSDKVVTMGENSKGMMGYGNVKTAQTPCYKYSFGVTTTKYNSFSRYEFIGIAPDIRLSGNQDWIKEAIEVLNK